MTVARPQGKRLAPKLALLCLSILLGLACGELTIRLTSPPPPKIPARDPGSKLFAINPREMAALRKPNTRGLLYGKLYSTNSYGFRGKEPLAPKPEGTFRIAVVGDSLTMGSGVADDDTYSSVLEEQLNSTHADRRFEVLNMGLNGLPINTIVARRVLRQAPPLAPDMIVYGYTLNDIEELPGYRGKEDRAPGLRGSAPLLGSELLGSIHRGFYYWRELLLPYPGSYVHELDENYLRNDAVLEGLKSYLEMLSGFGRSRGLCTVVFIHTRMHSLGRLHPFHRHYETVARAATESGLYVVESFPYFEGLDAEVLKVAPNDAHPNERGHELLAEALFDGLNDFLPASCWEPKWYDFSRPVPTAPTAVQN